MKQIDRLIENIRKEVELTGRSGGDCIFKTNVSFSIPDSVFDVPEDSDLDGAFVDFGWFLKAAENCSKEHPSPDKSFWLRQFGKDSIPYGLSWRLPQLLDNITSGDAWRRGVLINPFDPLKPPCVLSYQFQCEFHGLLDMTVTMRSCDMVKVLPQDILMSWFLLKHVSEKSGYDRGSMTFNIGNAHIFYDDLELPEEFTFDDGL
ncbi:MAG: hypothetical protein EB168_09440 [Euryarchaeota archaeon]|nr:hypothetical protein [Euryarchaeota archaeon]